MLVLLTACGGTSAGPASAGTTSAATIAATASVVASASAPLTTASAAAATSTAAIATPGRTVGSSSSALTTAPPATLSTTLSAASRLATSTATGSAGDGPVAEKLVFTGGVAGTVTSSPAPGECGKRDIDALGATHHVFRFGSITAQLGNDTYRFSVQVDPYKGPGTYATGPNGATAELFLSNAGNDRNYTSSGATLVVAPDEASGTVEADLSDLFAKENDKAHVSGSWRCR
jgi:hypothetical protein